MKIIYNQFIPFPGFKAINLFGIMFVRNKFKGKITDKTINHESIHTAQIKEMGYIFFYIWYIIEWLIRLVIGKNAYRNISFEREAFDNDQNLNYLDSRKQYAWFRYITNKFNKF